MDRAQYLSIATQQVLHIMMLGSDIEMAGNTAFATRA